MGANTQTIEMEGIKPNVSMGASSLSNNEDAARVARKTPFVSKKQFLYLLMINRLLRKRQISQRKESHSAEANQRCGSKELCSCAILRRISREQRHGPALHGTIQHWSGF